MTHFLPAGYVLKIGVAPTGPAAIVLRDDFKAGVLYWDSRTWDGGLVLSTVVEAPIDRDPVKRVADHGEVPLGDPELTSWFSRRLSAAVMEVDRFWPGLTASITSVEV